MKVIDHIKEAEAKGHGPQISYEIVPPPRGSSIKDIIDVVEELATLNPPWMDVTSHSSVTQYHERSDGSISKRTVRKRPGTLGICGIIQNRFKIDTVAHILCQGFSKEETEDALIELSFLGIHNCLALRGDAPQGSAAGANGTVKNRYAVDLVEQISEVRRGKFQEDIANSDPLDFCVGVAGYPEKHFEAPSLKIDIQNLKRKVDAGADYVTTQMFFDNEKFYAFEKAAREAGITVPIVPGLKILRSAAQLRTLPKAFFIDLPDALVDAVMKDPTRAEAIGQEWALMQAKDLINHGCKNLHFYVLNDARAVKSIVTSVLGK
ncbi:MAG: methylenetetrahydrofolate reductase [Bdellovibrionales bacterium]|nr:methylenetetrahydrofolate reductase [Bdellovibrionales bacterium]